MRYYAVKRRVFWSVVVNLALILANFVIQAFGYQSPLWYSLLLVFLAASTLFSLLMGAHRRVRLTIEDNAQQEAR